ncbi:MAG: peptidoglycan editing factor PgeF [Oscillospiraceae bacterium]|nr:peptidoglycan editing factor PgeF [Oscillospiraceae bacterium]
MILLPSRTLKSNISGDVPYYSFPSLDKLQFVRHGFSTRLGGVSTGVFQSMNLSFTRNDDKAAVHQNFERFCSAINVDVRNVVLPDQRHNTEIYNATANDRGRGIFKEKGYSNIDGLVTDEPNVVLCTQYADCVPLFFADKVRRVVGMAHAGWKGTAARIGRVIVERMCSDYGCHPKNIIAGIGPSIGLCCFEVDLPVYRIFADMEEIDDRCFSFGNRNKYHVDLWEINRRILLSAGLNNSNITVTDLCTRCHPDIFWSHRAAGSTRGSLAGFIAIA